MIGGSHTWHRHPDGILWMHDSQGTYTTFTHWLGWTIFVMSLGLSLLLFVVAPFVFATAIPRLWDKLRCLKLASRAEPAGTRPLFGDVSRTVIDG